MHAYYNIVNDFTYKCLSRFIYKGLRNNLNVIVMFPSPRGEYTEMHKRMYAIYLIDALRLPFVKLSFKYAKI